MIGSLPADIQFLLISSVTKAFLFLFLLSSLKPENENLFHVLYKRQKENLSIFTLPSSIVVRRMDVMPK